MNIDIYKTTLSILAVGIAYILAYYIWFGFVQGQVVSADTADWGTFGDYLGGVLGPIIALMTLLWLIEAVRLQRKELNTASKALRESSDSQFKTAMIQRASTEISALAAELNTLQSDISSLRDQLLFYAGAQSTQMGLDGEKLDRRKSLQQANKELEKKVERRDQLKQEIRGLIVHKTMHEMMTELEKGYYQ